MFVLYIASEDAKARVVGFAHTPAQVEDLFMQHLHRLMVSRAGTDRANAMTTEPENAGLFVLLDNTLSWKLIKREVYYIAAQPAGWLTPAVSSSSRAVDTVLESYTAEEFDPQNLLQGSLVPDMPPRLRDASELLPHTPCKVACTTTTTHPYMAELRAALTKRKQE